MIFNGCIHEISTLERSCSLRSLRPLITPDTLWNFITAITLTLGVMQLLLRQGEVVRYLHSVCIYGSRSNGPPARLYPKTKKTSGHLRINQYKLDLPKEVWYASVCQMATKLQTFNIFEATYILCSFNFYKLLLIGSPAFDLNLQFCNPLVYRERHL